MLYPEVMGMMKTDIDRNRHRALTRGRVAATSVAKVGTFLLRELPPREQSHQRLPGP